MNFNEYQALASRTAKTGETFKDQLVEYALGVTGEAGEISDIIKKSVFHGHQLNRDDVLKEIGDVQWYLANLARILATDLNTVAEMNIDKLKKRFPDGFNSEDSIRRVDTK